MFKIKLKNVQKIKTVIEILSNIIEETEIKVDPKKFIIQAMDPSRICLLKILLRKEDFDIYECENDHQICLNLCDLTKIMKRASLKDNIEFIYENDSNIIKIKMSREGSTRNRTFSLSLLDLEFEEIPLDSLLKIQYNSTWIIYPDILEEAIKDAEIYDDTFNIKAFEKKITLSAFGTIGEMLYEFGTDDLIDLKIEDEATVTYSLDFLKNILKIAPITEEMECSIKTDHPFKLKFILKEGGEILYFLAPRVKDENEYDDDEIFEDF